MIKTEVKMDIYEIDGKETHPVTGPKLTVRSVRPITARVDIVVGEHRYQVSRRDLEDALAATAHTGER